MAEKKPPRLVSRVTLAGSGSGGALRETPKQARREADPTDLPSCRINTHFCVIVARLTGSLIRKEDLSTGDFLRCPAISTPHQMKHWQIIADDLATIGWTWVCVSTVGSGGRTICIIDAHRGDGKRFVVRADEMLTAFVELEAAIQAEQSLA